MFSTAITGVQTRPMTAHNEALLCLQISINRSETCFYVVLGFFEWNHDLCLPFLHIYPLILSYFQLFINFSPGNLGKSNRIPYINKEEKEF